MPLMLILKGPLESVCINEESAIIKQVMLLRSKTPFIIEQKNTKEIKEDISIVKLNISNFHKLVIP